jgi:SNF2 family DNA or RNA helicase
VYAPYRLLAPELMPPTFTAFKTEYCIEKSMGGRYTRIVGYRNVDKLYARIAPITMRVTRDECLTLPDRQIIDRVLPLSAEQQRLQEELKTLTMAELADGLITATEASTRLIRFQQIANGFVARDDDPEGVVHPVDTPKTRALTDALLSYQDPKVIVWGRFHADIDRIVEACHAAEATVIRHDGRQTKDERDAALTAWRDPEGPRVLAATMQTLGIGRTLNEATLAVFYALTFDRVVYEQALARNYRAGQQHKVVVLRLLVKKSADDLMRVSLHNKDTMQQPLDALRALVTSTSTDS